MGLAVDAEFGGEDAAGVGMGWGGGGEGEFAAGAGLEIEGLEGVGGLPAVGAEEAGFEAGGAFGVVAEEEAVGAGFAGLDGAQVGDEAGPPEVDALVDGVVEQVADDAFFAGDEVAVFGGAARVPGDEFAVAGADEVGFDQVHDVGAAAVHPELEAVAQDGGLEELDGHVAGVAGRLLQEDVVAGEGDFLSIDVGGEDGVEFGLAGGVVDFELEFLPLEAFAVGELALDGDWAREGAGGAAPAGRVFEDLGDFVEGPDAGAFMPHEVGDAGSVVVVDVGDEDHVDVLDAIGVAELIEVVDDEAHGVAVFAFLGDGHVGPEGVAVVDEAGFAAFGEQDVEVGAGVGPAP